MYKSWYIQKAQVVDIKENVVDRINVILERQELAEDTSDFLKSLLEYYDKNNGLTSNQFKVLGDVENSLSPAGLAASQSWKESYDEEKRETALICAYYYVRTKYFTDVSKKIIENNSYVISEKTYKSMCENKYAKKIIRETQSEPKYPIGTLVKFRKTYAESSDICTVIGVDISPVISAAKGAKQYLVLPFGSSAPIEVEERHIKKYRKKMEVS
jgi:hypothetical protein